MTTMSETTVMTTVMVDETLAEMLAEIGMSVSSFRGINAKHYQRTSRE